MRMFRTSALCATALAAIATSAATPQIPPFWQDMSAEFDNDGLWIESGFLTIRGRASAGVQAAVYEPIEGGAPKTGSDSDFSFRLTAEYEAENGLLWGFRTELDTGNVEIEDFERDEFYVYLASQWGRVELGENDGPADTLFFHAPTTGLGQIRGDFARYTGSVALLSPYDSRDSLKITYLSAPFRNFRFGISYSPEWESNGSAPNPRDQTRQNDVVELGAQYVQPVGDWIWGVSAAVVKSEADPVTQREDIDSWGVGTQLRRGAWTFGTAFVQRGQSNRRFGSDNQYEWNAGAYWRGDDWRFAGSYALTRDGGDDIHRFGVGGSYEITENVFFRMDGVVTMDEREGRADREGWAVISEIGFRF